MEKDLIPKAGYEFRTVHISSFHRSLKLAEIKHNLVSLYNMVRSPAEARAILKEFRPDAVIGTGGYASYPTVKAAAKMGIPTAVHESNAVPGLTTELLEPYAGRIMVGFESCRQHYKHPEKVAVTGTPVREDFFTLTKEAAKEKLGVNDGRPLIVSFWGSLGASGMNAQMADMLALEAGKEPFHHIHGAGKSGYAAVLKALAEKGVDLKDHPSLQVREYIYDMAPVMRAADLVNIKLMKCGGIYNALKIAAAAEIYGVECMIGCMLEAKVSVNAAVHLACARQIITKIDLDGPGLCSEDPGEGGAEFREKTITVNDSPGLGIVRVSGIVYDEEDR